MLWRFRFTTRTHAVNDSLRAVDGQPLTRDEILPLQVTISLDVPEDALS